VVTVNGETPYLKFLKRSSHPQDRENEGERKEGRKSKGEEVYSPALGHGAGFSGKRTGASLAGGEVIKRGGGVKEEVLGGEGRMATGETNFRDQRGAKCGQGHGFTRHTSTCSRDGRSRFPQICSERSEKSA